MEKENAIKTKSYDFAIRIVNMYKHISDEKKEFVLSKQVLRSGTSIGANVQEAIGGSTRKDFSYKLGVAYKEARETEYWLNLLHDTYYLETNMFESIVKDCSELCKILYSIIQTTKEN